MAPGFSHKEAAKVKEAMARLSLAAEEKDVKPPCLSDEDLALLVDDFKAGKDLTRFKEHLSSCPECYDRWMSLVSVQLAASLRPEGKVHFLPGLLKQRYLGSALAVAAAIALFLNIYEPDQLVMQPPSQKSAETKAPFSEQVTSDAEMSIEQIELPDKPAAVPESPSPVTQQTKSLSEEQVSKTMKREAAMPPTSRKELKDVTPKTLQVERQSTDATAVFAKRRKQNIARDAEQSVQEWFAKVSYGCRKEQKNVKYWLARQKEWRTLSSSKAQIKMLSEETMQTATKIADLVQNTSEEGTLSKCEEILEILAEAPVNR